jgi:hypothetical protein
MLAVFNETLHHKRSMQIFIHQNSNVIIIMMNIQSINVYTSTDDIIQVL